MTDVAFGPVFDSAEEAEDFLSHLVEIGERDPRVIPAADLAVLAAEFIEERYPYPEPDGYREEGGRTIPTSR